MEFNVSLRYRNGKPLERAQLHGSEASGELHVYWVNDEKVGQVKCARLCKPGTQEEVAQPIFEVELIPGPPHALVLRGFERVMGRTGALHSVLQEWWLEYGTVKALDHAETQWCLAAGELHRYREKFGPLPPAEEPTHGTRKARRR